MIAKTQTCRLCHCRSAHDCEGHKIGSMSRPMRLVRGNSKGTRKMDCRVWQEAHRLYFPWPWRRASSSDDAPANAPSAEILGCRGGARSQKVRQGIVTTDEGSPHLE